MAETVQFIANLTDRQHSLMMSGSGQRTLVELEAFDINAVLALVGMVQFTGRQFLVTISELELDKQEGNKDDIQERTVRKSQRATT